MKDYFLYRSIAIMMAVVVLFTSTGFAMDRHFCQGELKSVAFFGQAESCHSMDKMTECPHHRQMACHTQKGAKSPGIDKDDCCQNETILMELDVDSVTADFADLTTNQVHFVWAFVQAFVQPVILHKSVAKKFVILKPPLPERDYQVLFESFLI